MYIPIPPIESEVFINTTAATADYHLRLGNFGYRFVCVRVVVLAETQTSPLPCSLMFPLFVWKQIKGLIAVVQHCKGEQGLQAGTAGEKRVRQKGAGGLQGRAGRDM